MTQDTRGSRTRHEIVADIERLANTNMASTAYQGAYHKAIDLAQELAALSESTPADRRSNGAIYKHWRDAHLSGGATEEDAHLRALDHISAQNYLRGREDEQRARQVQSDARHERPAASESTSRTEVDGLRRAALKNAEDAARWRALKERAGYWQDGSQTTVKLYQDDALRSCFIEADNKTYGTDGSSFNSAIDAAIAALAERERKP